MFEEFGITAKNYIWYRVLDGDKSDNINGVKGLGLKTIRKKLPLFQTVLIAILLLLLIVEKVSKIIFVSLPLQALMSRLKV